MTQHTDLIERLRGQSAELADTGRTLDYSAGVAAANALEAAAKNAFEAMPHDIPQRMKDAICEETGWSGSMVSRMYTELRKAFTGEPYKANEDLDAALLEVERLRKDAERTANNRDMWKSQCERQADELRKLRSTDADSSHSHLCTACAFAYTPAIAGSEDCPQCGWDGRGTYAGKAIESVLQKGQP